MSSYVRTISEEECIPDSYRTINANVSNLDAALVSIESLVNRNNLDSTEGVTKVLEGHNITVTSAGNSGTGIVVVGETICPPWHIGQTGKPLYSEAGTSTSGPSLPGERVTLAWDTWYDVDRYYSAGASADGYGTGANLATIGLTFKTPTNQTAVITYRAPGGTNGDDTYIDWNQTSIILSKGYPMAKTAVSTTNIGQYLTGGTKGFQFKFTKVAGSPEKWNDPVAITNINTQSFTSTNRVMKQVSDSRTLLEHLNDVVRENPPMPGGETVRNAGGPFPGTTEAYAGGVLLQDGRVFVVPYTQTTARIYDPKTDTVSTPSGTYPGNFALVDGVLLPDGRVFMSPRYGTNRAYIDNPFNDTLKTTDILFSGTLPFNQTSGAILLKDGRVLGIPYSDTSKQAYVYNPQNDTFTYTYTFFPGGNAFNGGTLLPDGKVFLTPYGSVKAHIYDPTAETLTPVASWPESGTQSSIQSTTTTTSQNFTYSTRQSPSVISPGTLTNNTSNAQTLTISWNVTDPNNAHMSAGSRSFTQTIAAGGSVSFSTIMTNWLNSNIGISDVRIFGTIATASTNTVTITTPAKQGYCGAILLPDGRVYVIPAFASQALIYNPTTQAVTVAGGTFPSSTTSNIFIGGALLPDGRVFIVPNNSTTARIYNPVTDTLTTPPVQFSTGGGNPYASCVLLQSGELYVIPYSSTTAKIVSVYQTRNFDNAALTGPFFNKL